MRQLVGGASGSHTGGMPSGVSPTCAGGRTLQFYRATEGATARLCPPGVTMQVSGVPGFRGCGRQVGLAAVKACVSPGPAHLHEPGSAQDAAAPEHKRVHGGVAGPRAGLAVRRHGPLLRALAAGIEREASRTRGGLGPQLAAFTPPALGLEPPPRCTHLLAVRDGGVDNGAHYDASARGRGAGLTARPRARLVAEDGVVCVPAKRRALYLRRQLAGHAPRPVAREVETWFAHPRAPVRVAWDRARPGRRGIVGENARAALGVLRRLAYRMVVPVRARGLVALLASAPRPEVPGRTAEFALVRGGTGTEPGHDHPRGVAVFTRGAALPEAVRAVWKLFAGQGGWVLADHTRVPTHPACIPEIVVGIPAGGAPPVAVCAINIRARWTDPVIPAAVLAAALRHAVHTRGIREVVGQFVVGDPTVVLAHAIDRGLEIPAAQLLPRRARAEQQNCREQGHSPSRGPSAHVRMQPHALSRSLRGQPLRSGLFYTLSRTLCVFIVSHRHRHRALPPHGPGSAAAWPSRSHAARGPLAMRGSRRWCSTAALSWPAPACPRSAGPSAPVTHLRRWYRPTGRRPDEPSSLPFAPPASAVDFRTSTGYPPPKPRSTTTGPRDARESAATQHAR